VALGGLGGILEYVGFQYLPVTIVVHLPSPPPALTTLPFNASLLPPPLLPPAPPSHTNMSAEHLLLCLARSCKTRRARRAERGGQAMLRVAGLVAFTALGSAYITQRSTLNWKMGVALALVVAGVTLASYAHISDEAAFRLSAVRPRSSCARAHKRTHTGWW
jgi:hypothetical protein